MGDTNTESIEKKRKRSKKSKSSSDIATNNTEGVDETAVKTTEDTADNSSSANGDIFILDRSPAPANPLTTITPKEEDDNEEKIEEGTEKKKRKRKRNRKKKNDTTTDNNTSNNSLDSEIAAKLSSVEHTVFIEGLPFTSSEEEIRNFFTEHGCNDILELRLPKWQDSGRLRGFGHVVFSSQETRKRALSNEVNGKEIGGRYITVKEANAPRAGTTAGASQGGQAREQPKGCKTVFVRNLPYDATEEHILEAFRTYGKIVDGGVRVVRNHTNGQSKGFGYVEYKTQEGALASVQKASKPFGLTVMNRPVFVDYDEGSMKGSFRDREGKLWNKQNNSGGNNGGRGGRGMSGRGMGGRGGRGFGGRGRGY